MTPLTDLLTEPVELRFDVGSLHVLANMAELRLLIDAATARTEGPRLLVVIGPAPSLARSPSADVHAFYDERR